MYVQTSSMGYKNAQLRVTLNYMTTKDRIHEKQSMQILHIPKPSNTKFHKIKTQKSISKKKTSRKRC